MAFANEELLPKVKQVRGRLGWVLTLPFWGEKCYNLPMWSSHNSVPNAFQEESVHFRDLCPGLVQLCHSYAVLISILIYHTCHAHGWIILAKRSAGISKHLRAKFNRNKRFVVNRSLWSFTSENRRCVWMSACVCVMCKQCGNCFMSMEATYHSLCGCSAMPRKPLVSVVSQIWHLLFFSF